MFVSVKDALEGGKYIGTYINPGNQAFKRISDPNYVDMTGLIRLMNDRVGGAQSLVCISRPRRFGKSYAAKMLAAYYDCSCDSHALFDKKIISSTKAYEEHAVYNSYSVMSACRERTCRSFWNTTSAAEAMTDYINMDFDGLQETVAQLIGGAEIEVSTSRFQNDFERFQTKDDVLTLLVHLGYLTYDFTQKTVHVPNEEVREEFRHFLCNDQVGENWRKLLNRSRKLMTDTVQGDGEAVAEALEEIRGENYAPQFYNNEQALCSVIRYAYISAIGQYLQVEEIPSGKGIADVVFIPTPLSRLPAMIVELKWNKTAGGAISHIKLKRRNTLQN